METETQRDFLEARTGTTRRTIHGSP